MTVFWTTLENIFQHQQLGWWGGGWRVAGLCVHEQWEAALCHLLQSPSLAPLTGASGGPKLFQQPMMWRMLSASPALQPAWSLWHCRGRTGPVHSEFLVVHAQCPAGPASGVSASFFFLLHKEWEVAVLRIWMNHHCPQNKPWSLNSCTWSRAWCGMLSLRLGESGAVTLGLLSLVFSVQEKTFQSSKPLIPKDLKS